MKKTWLGILWLFCSASGFGQDWSYGQLPATTQIYLESQPRLVLNSGPSLGERVRRSPLFRVFAGAVQLDPNKADELGFPYLDGRFLFALVRQGQLSPFEGYYQADKKVTRLRDLRYAAESAFEGVTLYRKFQKQFPKSVADLSEKEYFDAGNIPEGARLELRRDGKIVTVLGHWDDLEVRWPDPDYKSVGYNLSDLGGMLFGLGCPDSVALNTFLTRWDKELEELEAEGDHWKFTFDGQAFYLFLSPRWVWLTTHPDLVSPFLKAPTSNQSLRNNLRFADQARRLQAPDSEFWSFVDVQDILSTSPGLCASGGVSADKVLIRSLALTSGAHLDTSGRIEVQARGFMHWDGVQNVTLGPASAQSLAVKIPAQVETVYWIDLPGWIRVVDRLAGEFPGVNEGFVSAWTELEKRLGFSLPRESLAGGAQLYIYGEVIDSYANQLELVLQLMKGYLGTSSAGIEEALKFSGSKVPLLGVLEMANPDLAGKVEARLKERLGAQSVRKKVENVSYTLSQDGRCAWASNHTTQFWANGYTERMLPRVFSAYQASDSLPPKLSASPSYQLFEQGRQGELLLYLHSKMDREYSLIKGMLLYLGTDFRPEAEKLGQLRDMHTAIEVVPGGISLRTAVYSEGVAPPPPRLQEGEEE
ncbi:hypothetical protein IV102_22300 [bacterium]|nr:hypothetical protein [bacterium]